MSLCGGSNHYCVIFVLIIAGLTHFFVHLINIHFCLQVSQVYQTIEFDRLAKLAPFADAFRLERIIVDTARNLELQVK